MVKTITLVVQGHAGGKCFNGIHPDIQPSVGFGDYIILNILYTVNPNYVINGGRFIYFYNNFFLHYQLNYHPLIFSLMLFS